MFQKKFHPKKLESYLVRLDLTVTQWMMEFVDDILSFQDDFVLFQERI